jgi:pilus assembly protein Flp/PilA
MNGFAMYCSAAARDFARLLRDESGATAIEYGLIAAGVGGAIAATVFSFGTSIKTNLFQKVLDAFN